MSALEELAQKVQLRKELPSPSMRRALRLSAGLTLDDLASALGCTRQAVGNWETGRRKPGKAFLIPYFQVLVSLRDSACGAPPGVLNAMVVRTGQEVYTGRGRRD